MANGCCASPYGLYSVLAVANAQIKDGGRFRKYLSVFPKADFDFKRNLQGGFNMKRMYIFLIICIGSIFIASPLFACTTFAVFGNQVLYGMNFDYFLVPLKFIIDTHGSIKTFHLAFNVKLPGMDFFAKTGGMNSKGLFGACQVLMPPVEAPSQAGNNDVFIAMFYETFAPLDKVQTVENLLKDKRLINFPGASHHNLYADTSGNAMIIEPGADKNHITKIEDNFIVMTNFPIHGLKGKNYSEAKGMGADRYKIAYEYLRDNVDNFTIDKGFELLQKAINKDPGLATRCSMIFDPIKNEIFIAIDGNFNKIWKVSLEESTIETFSGFDTSIKKPLDSNGLMALEISIKTLNDTV
jgi:hypothetical protein